MVRIGARHARAIALAVSWIAGCQESLSLNDYRFAPLEAGEAGAEGTGFSGAVPESGDAAETEPVRTASRLTPGTGGTLSAVGTMYWNTGGASGTSSRTGDAATMAMDGSGTGQTGENAKGTSGSGPGFALSGPEGLPSTTIRRLSRCT
jgi:hypothetical protein